MYRTVATGTESQLQHPGGANGSPALVRMLEDEDLGGDADARAGEHITPTDAARALALCAQGASSRPGLRFILVHFFKRGKKWEQLSEKFICKL